MYTRVRSSLVPEEPDPVLTAERSYLAAARADLARMRERTLALDVQSGDALSAA